VATLDDDSAKWWHELEFYENQDSDAKWCCEAIKESGFEGLQGFDFKGRSHTLLVRFCFMCGRKL